MSGWRLFCKKWTHLNKRPLVKSLVDCQKLTEHGFKTAEDLAQLGEIAILGYVGDHNEKLWSFTKKASRIKLDSLPGGPLPVDVLCLSARLDDSVLNRKGPHF